MVAKKKTWGDEGFIGKISYGCFDYSVEFLPQEKIKELLDDDELGNVYGAINSFSQQIYIASDTTVQNQKATLLHELVHAIFLKNGSMQVGKEEETNQNITSEILIDTTANGIFEIVRRNPDLFGWLMK